MLLGVFSLSQVMAQGITIRQTGGSTKPCPGEVLTFVAEGLGVGQKCEWTWSGANGDVVGKDENNKKCELQLYGLPNAATSGTLTLVVDGLNTINLPIMVVRFADPAEARGALSNIFCQGLEHTFSIAPDPRNNPDSPNYYGMPVRYIWNFYSEGGTKDISIESTDPFVTFALPIRFKNGRVTLNKQTCADPTEYDVVTLRPFIEKPPLPLSSELRAISYSYIPGTSPLVYSWGVQQGLAACTFYSDQFNNPALTGSDGNTIGPWGTARGRGYGDGYLYLQVGHEAIDSLVYDWSFDPTEFEFASPAVYDHPDLKNHGFGKNAYRVCLKVLNKEAASNTNLNVSVVAHCPSCNALAGNQEYKTDSYTITVERQDSLLPYKNFDVLADPNNMPLCAGMEVSFKTQDKDGLTPTELKDNYRITKFWYAPGQGSTESQNPPTPGYDINLLVNVRTPGVNDSLRLTVYPSNACFKNKKDNNQQQMRIPVASPPAIPLFFDGDTTIIQNTVLDVEGKWDIRDPYLVCNGNESRLFEYCIVKSKKETDSIAGIGWTLPDFMEGADMKTEQLDSITVKFGIRMPSDGVSRTGGYGRMGIYALNRCGNGDTAYFWVHVIDTIKVYDPIKNSTGALEDTICEGSPLELFSSQTDYTNVINKRPLTDPAKNPKPRNQWVLPSSWSYQLGSDSSQMPIKILVGETTGAVKLRYGNKCGWSSYESTKIIEPRRFTRVNIASERTPCQGDTVTYTIDSVRDASRYIWQFPSDWVTLNGSNTDTSYNLESVHDTVIDPHSLDIISITGTMSMRVIAGAEAGYIYVTGENDICDYTLGNYTQHRRDSLKVNPKAWTKKPYTLLGFSDTLCARDTVYLEIAPHDQDTAKAVYYTWHFTGPDWEEYQNFSADTNNTKLRIVIPDNVNRYDSIRIIGHRRDCEAFNRGDTLVYRFYIKDTVSVVGDIRNHDASELNVSPCEGDIVFYVLDKALMDPSVRGIHWSWDTRFAADTIKEIVNIDGVDTLVIKEIKIGTRGWVRLSPYLYGDTLAMRVGGDTLAIFASAVNCCGISKSVTDTILPVNLITEVPVILSPAMLCTQENIVFSLNSTIKNATIYTWHYPWGEGIVDSLPPTSGLPIFEPAVQAYDTGYVKIVPRNQCGVGPADSIHISYVYYPPSRPLPANFAPAFNPDTDSLAVFDTVCLRQENILKLKRNPAKDSLPLEYSWDIMLDAAMNANLDLEQGDGVLDNSDSTYRVVKNAGLDSSLIVFSSRIAGCQRYGDSLFVQIRGRDTVAVAANKDIRDYVRDAFSVSGLVELLPCATADSYAKYYLDRRIDSTLISYRFRFGKDITNLDMVDPDQVAGDGTFNGTNWKIQETSLLPDSLHVKIGSDTIFLQVETINVCGRSTFPVLHIKTIGTAPHKIEFIQIDSSICYREKTDTFRVTKNDTISSYIWHSPWRPVNYTGQEPAIGQPYIDTTYMSTREFEVDSSRGIIYVEPRNGCVNSHPKPTLLYSDTVKIENIIYPPKRLRPNGFAPTYDPLTSLLAIDTLCLRNTSEYVVSHDAIDTLALDYKWELTKQTYTEIIAEKDTLRIQKTEGADTTFVMVSAKVSVCETYGDTLKIQFRTMDTVPMPLPIEAYIHDAQAADANITLRPCGFQTVAYYIDQTFHWSIDSAIFNWNGGNLINDADSTLANTDWKIIDKTLLPDTLHAYVGNSDTLFLQAQIRNMCGWSKPTPITVAPLSLINFKPRIYIDPVLCNKDTIYASVDSVPFATHYVWHFPWKPKNYQGPDLQVGEYYTDTVTTHYRFFTDEYDTGLVWVSPMSRCSQGEDSDTFNIQEVVYPPHALVPNSMWFDNIVAGDTIFDTICRYKDQILRVSPNSGDIRDSLVYHWSLLEGSLKFNPSDDDTVVIVNGATSAPELNHISVAVRWNICKTYSDSLHIKLYVVDTASIMDIGAIIPIDPNPFRLSPCPGAEMEIGIQNEFASPAYKWSFTDTSWHIKKGTDSASGRVIIVAGSQPTQIGVVPITDATLSVCPYFASSPLSSTERFIPVPPIQTEAWKEGQIPIAEPCVGTYQTYYVQATADADAYRWEFPYGWTIEGTTDSIQTQGVDTCRVLVGKTEGKVSVYAIDTCDYTIPLTIQGLPTFAHITPVDSARVLFEGDRQPCVDSTSIYFVTPNRSTQSYTIEYITDPIDADRDGVFTWNAAQTQLSVRWNPIKAVTFILSPISNGLGGCNTFVNDTIYIKADTVPYISGAINGNTFICMNDIYEYRAHADMDTAGSAFSVTYSWELPNNTWRFLSNPDSSWVRVVSGIYMDNQTDIIKCYPRAGCGTGNPFEFPVQLNKPDTLYNAVFVEDNDTNPCVGTQIGVRLTHANYDFDTISFYWFTPPSWEEINPDSAGVTARFIVGKESDTIFVRGLRVGSCGLSAPLGVYVHAKEKPDGTQFIKTPYPCVNEEKIGLSIKTDLNTDSVLWKFPDEIEYRLFQNRIKYDSVFIAKVGENPIPLHLTAYNKCGFTDTLINIHPVTEIQNFEDGICLPYALCANDTTYAQIQIPVDHLEKGTEYNWTLPLDWTYLLDSVVVNQDTIWSRVWFNTTEKSGKISVYAANACGEIPEKEVKADLYRIDVQAIADPKTVPFMESGIMLEIESISPGTLEQYDYEWSPRNRVYKNEDDFGNSEWWTGELIYTTEYFAVKAIDKVTGFQCVGRDTVAIDVKNAFQVNLDTRPFVCVSDSVRLYANPTGGDTERYFFKWASKQGEIYMDLEDALVSQENPIVPYYADTMYFRLIACDTIEVNSTEGSESDADVLPKIQFIVCDTQYISTEGKTLSAKIIEPFEDKISMKVGDYRVFEALIEGGTGEILSIWRPSELFKGEDSLKQRTQSQRFYEEYPVYFIATDTLSGCVSSDTVLISLDGDFGTIPNAFTPNNDGINDVFMTDVDLVIFNRLGMEIFRSKNKEGWDGTYKGKLVDKDDYLYIVTVNTRNRQYVKKGTVTVF